MKKKQSVVKRGALVMTAKQLSPEQKAKAYDALTSKRSKWSANYRKSHPDKVAKWSADYRKRTQRLLQAARDAGLGEPTKPKPAKASPVTSRPATTEEMASKPDPNQVEALVTA